MILIVKKRAPIVSIAFHILAAILPHFSSQLRCSPGTFTARQYKLPTSGHRTLHNNHVHERFEIQSDASHSSTSTYVELCEIKHALNAYIVCALAPPPPPLSSQTSQPLHKTSPIGLSTGRSTNLNCLTEAKKIKKFDDRRSGKEQQNKKKMPG